ncbi:unnamed protein product [Rotaria sordida]|uniref:Protein YIPF n=1 Tax=Rotaria sordida TaxID=392033 RepID=A0A819BXT7_9BILA|nr:unnamed protein product [Rotaria sordida]CAF0775234.1 unnamed protein product [Rotaria sordida]CAF0828945.1 unnamed protein product [Rotaria sordida]CAF3811235.1 unnamed protein product [Rotaria sordida]
MSWNSQDFFSSSPYNQQYTGSISYDFQQQQQQQQQNYSLSQPYTQYSNDNFIPSPYNFNSQVNNNQFYYPNHYIPPTATSNQNDDEPPLLEELGINFDHIFKKTKSVLNPFAIPDLSIRDDIDLAGPLIFCLIFAFSLLLFGKIHFGYVYGIVTLGTFGMYGLLNLMASSDKSCSGLFVISVLGYCLLPMVILSFLSFLFKFNSFINIILTIIFILWCSISASKLFTISLAMIGQQLLVAYPCVLFYGVFALLTMF